MLSVSVCVSFKLSSLILVWEEEFSLCDYVAFYLCVFLQTLI